MKDPVEVQPPAGDLIFIVLRVEVSRDPISLALLDNVHLNLGHGSVIEGLVSGSPGEIFIAGAAHRVNCPIASNTG